VASLCPAVTSNDYPSADSSRNYQKRRENDVIIGSRGTMQLGRRAETIVKQFDDVWSINSIVSIGDTVYVGQAQRRGLFIRCVRLKKIYAAKLTKKERPKTVMTVMSMSRMTQTLVGQDRHFANEHIFAMAADASGHLLVGISGQRWRVMPSGRRRAEDNFEPNDANYIFAISVDKGGEIYLGTGPKGKIYRLDSSGKHGKVLYDSSDKNILSLAQGSDGFIMRAATAAGYLQDKPKTKEAVILYDSEPAGNNSSFVCSWARTCMYGGHRRM